MGIVFSCTCGKAFNVKTELAGRPARCSDCRTILRIPPLPEPDPSADFELLEDEPAPAPAAKPARAAIKPQLVEDEEPPRPTGPKIKGVGTAAPSGATPAEPKKKKKRRKRGDKPGSLAAMYMAAARTEQKRDDILARSLGGGGGGDGGWAFNWGMAVSSVGTLLLGLVFLGIAYRYPTLAERAPGIFISGVICTILGPLGLIRAFAGKDEEE
jgi:hypothetical protein